MNQDAQNKLTAGRTPSYRFANTKAKSAHAGETQALRFESWTRRPCYVLSKLGIWEFKTEGVEFVGEGLVGLGEGDGGVGGFAADGVGFAEGVERGGTLGFR